MWSPAHLAAACSAGEPSRTIAIAPAGQTAGEISAFAFDSAGTLWMTMPDEA